MKKSIVLLGVFLCCVHPARSEDSMTAGDITLPAVKIQGTMSVEEAILKRRSVRDYADEALTLAQVSQLLWAAQGITAPWGGRAAPSAGATFPLEVYLAARKVRGLEPGIYRYVPQKQSLRKISAGDRTADLRAAALGQACVGTAPVNIVICADYRRTTGRYGERGVRYVHNEVGHAGQNIHLQAEALGLATVVVGAFSDEKVQEVLGVDEDPQYIMPVGKPK